MKDSYTEMYQPGEVIAALSSFSAASWSAPVEAEAAPSAFSIAGSVAFCRFMNPPYSTPCTKPSGLPIANCAPQPSGVVVAAAKTASVEVAVTKFIFTPIASHCFWMAI